MCPRYLGSFLAWRRTTFRNIARIRSPSTQPRDASESERKNCSPPSASKATGKSTEKSALVVRDRMLSGSRPRMALRSTNFVRPPLSRWSLGIANENSTRRRSWNGCRSSTPNQAARRSCSSRSRTRNPLFRGDDRWHRPGTCSSSPIRRTLGRSSSLSPLQRPSTRGSRTSRLRRNR